MSEYIADERQLARFWARVDKNGPIHPKLGTRCWLWTGAISLGYGKVTVSQGRGIKHYRTHRLAYECLVGQVPAGLVLDHLCKNRACCNPKHLEPVTQRTNVLRGDGVTALNSAKTHCKFGHLLAGDNLFLSASNKNHRGCKTCRRKYSQLSQERRKDHRKARRKELASLKAAKSKETTDGNP